MYRVMPGCSPAATRVAASYSPRNGRRDWPVFRSLRRNGRRDCRVFDDFGGTVAIDTRTERTWDGRETKDVSDRIYVGTASRDRVSCLGGRARNYTVLGTGADSETATLLLLSYRVGSVFTCAVYAAILRLSSSSYFKIFVV